jgi:hypothetical protein
LPALAVAALVGALGAACGDDPAGPVPFEKAAYMRSTVGAPWNQTTNEDAMDQAFGAGEWDDLRFETADLDSLFVLYTFLFLEGSDDNADEMEAFIAANQTALEAFVQSGRRVLINSAPNEGDGMSFGFGVDLIYEVFSDEVEAVNSSHPIFVATDSTEFRGGSFGHAIVVGPNLTPIIQMLGQPDSVVLAERSFGAGRALFGGMTTDNYHDPQPEAHTLRINILRYAAGVPLP